MKWIKGQEGSYINIDSFYKATILKTFPNSDRYHVFLENKYQFEKNEKIGSFTFDEATEWIEENLNAKVR